MVCKIYATDEYKDYAANVMAAQSVVGEPEIVSVPGGIVVVRGHHSKGVYNRFGLYVKQSDITKGKHWHHRFVMPWCVPARYMDMNVMYMGNVHRSFGHFLLEHTNRMWAIGAVAVDKYVFMRSKLTKGHVPEFVYRFMEMAGVRREDILIVDKNTRFKNVYVPSASTGRDFTSDAWGRTFDNMVKSGGAANRKVYLSRCALPERTVFGEEKIQRIFAKNGFDIVYPEQLPLDAQAKIVSNASVLAGCAGTALHLALFMKPGGTVIQIKRNSKISDNFPAQNLINDTKHLRGVFVQASIETMPTEHFSAEPQLIGMNENMKRFMDDFSFVYDADDLAPDTAAINQYNHALDGRGAVPMARPTRLQKIIKKLKKI